MGRTCRLENVEGDEPTAAPWAFGSGIKRRRRNPLGFRRRVCSRSGVSRILFNRDEPDWAIISLGRLSPTGSSSLPADVPAFAGAPCGRGSPLIWPCCRWGLPCRPGHPERGALLPHHFTLTGEILWGFSGGILSVALSVGLLRLDVIKHQTRQGGVTRPSAVRTFLAL